MFGCISKFSEGASERREGVRIQSFGEFEALRFRRVC